MKQLTLGRTGIEISPVGLGCWQFAGGVGMSGYFWSGLDEQTVVGIVRESLEGGVTWFDTAEVYGRGVSERTLAAALRALDVQPGSVVIADKWFPLWRRASSITRTFPARAAALDPYPVDLHQVHMPLSLSSIPRQMDRLADLCDQKKIRAVGVSNFSSAQMVKAHRALERRGLSLASNQVRYNLLHRVIESDGVLDCARDLGVTIIAYSPLAQGVLTGRFHRDPSQVVKIPWVRRRNSGLDRRGLVRTAPLVRELERVGEAHGASAAQTALAWLVEKNPGRVAVIPGASRPEQARLNARALALALSPEEVAGIDRLSVSAGR